MSLNGHVVVNAKDILLLRLHITLASLVPIIQCLFTDRIDNCKLTTEWEFNASFMKTNVQLLLNKLTFTLIKTIQFHSFSSCFNSACPCTSYHGYCLYIFHTPAYFLPRAVCHLRNNSETAKYVEINFSSKVLYFLDNSRIIISRPVLLYNSKSCKTWF